MSLPNAKAQRLSGVVIIYDLRDPEAWESARRERRAWGRSRAPIHVLDDDHVAIIFQPAGARGRGS